VKRFFWITVTVEVIVLVVSTWPGLLASVVFDFWFVGMDFGVPGFFIAVPLAVVWLLAAWVIAMRPSAHPFGLYLAASLVVTALLLWFSLPQAAGFSLSRSSFQRFLSAQPIESSAGHVTLNRRFGIYRVAQVASDSRGGTYFQVRTVPDFVDTLSYGFALQPNRDGTPFGAARYTLAPLGLGWYAFRASDDY